MKSIYDQVKADCLISQMDIWMLKGYGEKTNWFPYTPIEHIPLSPFIGSALQTAKKPIAMSRFGVKQLDNYGIPNWYIPHGVNTQIYYPDKDKGNGVRKANDWGDRFVIGCVGTNKVERKNFRKLLMAFKQFHDKHNDSLLYLHTEPLDKQGVHLPNLVQILGLEKAVCFPADSVVPPSEEHMAKLYNSFDVYCMPSKGEGFGLPIIEAQACGVPVVITDFSSMSELCGNGYLIKKWNREYQPLDYWMADADEDEIVKCLEQLYYAPRGVKNAAVEFAKQYDWHTVTKDYWAPVLKEIEEMVCDRTKPVLEGVHSG